MLNLIMLMERGRMEDTKAAAAEAEAMRKTKPDEKRKIRMLLFSIRHIQHKTIIRSRWNTGLFMFMWAMGMCQLFKRNSFATLTGCIAFVLLFRSSASAF